MTTTTCVHAAGCFCGAIRIECTGEPVAAALCHCTDCQRRTGCPYTNNFLFATSALKIVRGTPKRTSKTADSGTAIVNYFCGDCGTPLYGHSRSNEDDAPGETTVVRAGVFDDVEFLNAGKPQVEIYTERRLKWVEPVEGAMQVVGMLKT